ncbi:MAG: EAL domain-containing protein, partial [Sphaerospermopsis sp. SIO1G2]|nr:EAL domain-containing protein [Sphaerospermopsis sp. SIO1G2]
MAWAKPIGSPNGGTMAWLLEIELTESMIIENVDCAISIMSKLCSLGFNIAIDDFGTGQSS